MSKTLGNVIDPIDTMKEYGTDALQFSLSLGTAGQDLNLSTERLALNKAFVNKLWNAGKFILQNLPSQDNVSAWENILAYKFDTEESLLRLSLPECWVVSELHELIDVVTSSYERFFFGDVGRETYDFFWGDFANWYESFSFLFQRLNYFSLGNAYNIFLAGEGGGDVGGGKP
ncbi:hypothetical protein Syun_014787 [Stephania yunnanensis]|uniref:valine--tRNA ligase n=1 Tax=Stephania yunnanensis TaxID=152371 RepID=A0AAP0P944_9MAGN